MQAGQEKLKQFEEAPPEVQKAFLAKLRKRVDWEHELSRFQEEVDNEDAPPTIELRQGEPATVAWSPAWRKRAFRYRRQHEGSWDPEEATFEAQKDRLLEILAEDYVEALTGEEVGRNHKICCPLHDERTPSFSVRATTWHCFGCGKHGRIYDLASELWSLPLQGRSFKEIHERLLEIYP